MRSEKKINLQQNDAKEKSHTIKNTNNDLENADSQTDEISLILRFILMISNSTSVYFSGM